MNRRWFYIILVSILPLAALYGSAPLFLPKPVPSTASTQQFSAQRALTYVQNLAQIKRVAGTDGMLKAVDYIVTSLQACHLDPEIQKTISTQGTLRNVIIRIRGSNKGNSRVDAFLIVTHVDSVSYGAGDNASGAAVLLEAACNLQGGAPMQNDLILLFEDGEEQGYLGGYAFAKGDPSIAFVRRVIGLDTAAWGPVVLLQTTPANADFIKAYAATVHKPTAFGFFADADWNISKDTSEIQPFYEKGIPGLELEDPTAFTWKHTDADTVDKVKPGSMQQMGDQVLALAHQLGNSDLTNTNQSNRSYFTLWGLGVVNYPASINLLLCVLSAFGLIVLTVQIFTNRSITAHGLFFSLGLLFLLLIGAALIGQAASILFTWLFPNPNPSTGSYLLPASLPFFLATLVIVTALYLFVRKQVTKKTGLTAVSLAGLYLWVLIALLFSVVLPVGSYMIALPLFLILCARFLPVKLRWIEGIPAVAAIILLVPNAGLAFLGAGMQVLVIVTFLVALNVELMAGIDFVID